MNEKHMEGWATMCKAAGILNTPLTPYLDPELLAHNHLAVDGRWIASPSRARNRRVASTQPARNRRVANTQPARNRRATGAQPPVTTTSPPHAPPPLDHQWTTTAPPLHYHYTTTAPPLFHHYTTTTSPLLHCTTLRGRLITSTGFTYAAPQLTEETLRPQVATYVQQQLFPPLAGGGVSLD